MPVDPNPYASPTGLDATPPQPAPMFPRPQWLWFPVVWAALLFFGLPAAQHIPLGLRITSSLVSLAAVISVFRSANAFGHLLCAPLYLGLAFLQFVVWVFPSFGPR